jgi:hypothetical protein
MAHILACKRRPVAKLFDLLPVKYVEQLEQNQRIATCCRHPENHDIEAWSSCETERQNGTPDIYKMYCTCGRVHVRFCVGSGYRPIWDVR